MAVALSLLIVLPTLAQVSGERTDGRVSVGDWIDVRIADKLTGDIDANNATVSESAPAYAIGDDAYEAKDTYFDDNLYVSNKENAYNTILITAKVADGFLADQNDPSTTPPVTDKPCDDGDDAAVATVRNTRNNSSVKVYLVDSGDDDSTVTVYHGIVAVWDQEASVNAQSGPCAAHGDPEAYVGSDDQSTDATLTNADTNSDGSLSDDEIRGYIPAENADGWTDDSAAVLPARDGDTLTITVAGVAGSISVVVDGDAPEVDAVSPASGVTNETTVNLQFTASDDGAGLRFDGESGMSSDPDLRPHNGDDDNTFAEPFTAVGDNHAPGAATPVFDYGDGATEDIKVYFADDDEGDRLPYLHHDTQAQTEDATDTTTDPATPNDPNPDFTGIYMNFVDDDESSARGSNDWEQVDNKAGVEYALDMRLVGKEFGTYYWQVTVKDRVGNSFTTDGDEDEPGNQPYKFTIDNAGPIVDPGSGSSRSGARTGVSYEPGVGEKADRAWIALSFINYEKGGPDSIDAATVDPGDFTVGGHTVIQTLVPSEKKCENAAGKTGKDLVGLEEACLSSPGSRIYLQLSADLASDERPTIQVLGGAFKDVAGNNNITDSFRAVDKIAPGITITIVSSTGTANRTASDDDGTFTVSVSSDEDLSKFPRLYFASIKGAASIDEDGKAGSASDLEVFEVSTVYTMNETDTNTWEKKVKAEDDKLPDDGTDRVLAVIVTAADEANDPNDGNSAGWKGSGTPGVGDGLDFKKLDAGGFLVEIDNDVPAAVVTVRPAADPSDLGANETESSNPYIELYFAEADEYSIRVTDDQGTPVVPTDHEDYDADVNPADDDVDGTATKVDIGDGDTLRTDSHRAVTLTALAIDGEDRLADAVRVDPWKYVLAVTGLEVGDYDITYEAMDDVGNEVDEDLAKDSFEVLERQPYEVTLDPGWNLISVPGDPFNPAVGSVIGADLKADTVLGYQGGEWVTAVRNEDGRWQGTLTDIVGGYGYWVRTSVVEDIETVIPPILPTAVLPTVPIVAGWNLVGVVDAEQHDVDTAGAEHNAGEYLTSLGRNWRVAYSYETQQNSWKKLLPSDDAGVMENGSGYWLWNVAPGVLVP